MRQGNLLLASLALGSVVGLASAPVVVIEDRVSDYEPAPSRRSSASVSSSLPSNRGSGSGYQRAIAREAKSAEWRLQFYADWDAQRNATQAA